jgi:hypothetical protein
VWAASLHFNEVFDLKNIGGWVRHLQFAHEQWPCKILLPTLHSIFGGENLEYLGLLPGGDGVAAAGNAEGLEVAVSTCLAVVGQLDMYTHQLIQVPYNMFLLPVLPSHQQDALLRLAALEWKSVLELEKRRPGYLKKHVPMTASQFYREMHTVRLPCRDG